MRYQALIEYDGTDYLGFQRQRDGQPTVQGELETAISRLARQPTSVTGAGRTDSGVHATGQVISFDLDWRHGVDALQRAINANLPADIVVLKLNEAPPEFHPRFDALRRAYEYYVYNAEVRSPVRRQHSWHVRRNLDEALMNQAAAHLVGIHDFATFGNPPQGISTTREVFTANWKRQDELLIFYIEANAFLYRMVRTIVGSLKSVGEGKWSVEDFVTALHACDRSWAATVAPPQGLYLVSVAYSD